jgi:very-short-patch-repair endonuclease
MRNYDQARTGAVLRARQLRRDSTDAEKRIWRALRSSLPEFKWRRQLPIGPYFADLACFAEKLVVELDGGQHAESVAYDAARTRYLEAQGYRVIRFGNNDVLGNLEGVIQAVAAELSSSPSRSDAAGPSLSQGRGVEVPA